MPYRITKTKSGTFRVSSPHGVKAKGTSKKKAEAQVRLLNAKEHDPEFTPRRKKRRH